MAAYAALTSLMNVVDDIENHDSPPISLDKQQVEFLTEIVTSLEEFLEVYNSPFAVADEADPLEMRIADAAYAAEDVIETHIVNTIDQKKSIDGETSTSCVADHGDEQINCSKFHHDLQQVIEQMDQIKKVAMETNTDQRRRNEISSFDSTLTPSSSTTMVYSDAVLLGMLEKLTRGQLDRQVISIVGMGGIGKTTLARNIYMHPLTKNHFDIYAWATISQKYDTRELLCEVLSQVTNTNNEKLSDMSEDKLGLELRKHLYSRRFLIVMDDMWSIDAWEKIQLYLPNNENGSRILVTTRLLQLSSQLNDNGSLRMEFLDEVSSWDLFSKIVFGEGNCPPELEKIGKKIADNCKGLPLSIIVVGGLLKKMDRTPECWESISNNLTSVVNLENNKHCLRLLRMSYNHLPAYLKPCFLYMGVFEEDDRIKVSALIKLWDSEGFLKAKNDKSLKTIAIGFLEDLVDRNLVLVDTLGSTGEIKYCRIHDLLRDMCLNEAHKNGFYHVVGVGSRQGISTQRRVVIRRNTSKNKVLEDLKSMPHARSIICEYGNLPNCRNLRLLRTLHECKSFHNNKDQSYVNFLVRQNVNLRHLAIGSIDSSFLSSRNHLWNFQTLIVCDSSSTVPIAIWKMPQFRYIKFVKGTCYHPNLPFDINDVDIMKNLETLKGVVNFKCGESMAKRIPNIKKLEINYHEGLEGDDDYYFTNFKLLPKLETLWFSNLIAWKGMQKLTFPYSLRSLTLRMSRDFEWEEILDKIGWLTLLQKLRLQEGCFGKGKWQVVEGQFPSVKFLELYECVGLKQWTVVESHVLPCLEQLRLFELKELEEIPHEIGDIPTLQVMWLVGCSDSVVKSAKEIVDEQVEMQGEELSFHVKVLLSSKNETLESLTTPNIRVRSLGANS